MRIAIIDGLSEWNRFAYAMGDRVRLYSFANELRSAGHSVILINGAVTEYEMINILNSHQMVVVVAHGGEDYYDANKTPQAMLVLGGITQLSIDQTFPAPPGGGGPVGPSQGTLFPEVISANELDGMVNNPTLELLVAGCRTGRTSRLRDAVRPKTFVGSTGDINSVGVDWILQYVVDRLTSGEAVAQATYLARSKRNVVNPTNKDFR